MGVKPKQTLDQSLTSLGGWLRSIDAQIISFIRSEDKTWTEQNVYLSQSQCDFDIPEWIYQDRAVALGSAKALTAKRWFNNLANAAWHTSRDWRRPLPGLGLNQVDTSAAQTGAFSLSYVYVSPVHQRLGISSTLPRAHQMPFGHYPDRLSPSWSTSYQFSTALAILLPIAVNIAQSPAGSELLTWVSRSTKPQAVSLEVSQEKITPKPTAVQGAKISAQLPYRLKQPTGKIANIQSYILPTKGEFTSGYGMRWGRLHRGVDIAGPIGTPIVAAAAGKVVTAGWSEDGFGNKVEIQHPDGTITLYAHSSRIVTRVGAYVRQGEQIAEIGTSGFSTGPHLHFQIHPRGKETVDPLFFFGRSKILASMRPSA